MAVKKTKKKPSKVIKGHQTTKWLTPKQELFCQLFVRGSKIQFGNATRSYIDAYGIDLDVRNEDWSPNEKQSKKNKHAATVMGSRT